MNGFITRLGTSAFLLASLSVWGIQTAQAHPASQASTGSSSAGHLQPGGRRHGNLTNPYVKIYCDGTGVNNNGVDCPCGNTLPPGADQGCANRTGHGASLIPTGVPSVSNDTLLITATGMPLGVPAFFFAGATTGLPIVIGNGIRCISGPITRLTKVAHASSSDSYPAPGTPPISVQLNVTPGTATYFQCLYRDTGGPCGGTVNATNAIMVLWGT